VGHMALTIRNSPAFRTRTSPRRMPGFRQVRSGQISGQV
jgi:hypothetical protein